MKTLLRPAVLALVAALIIATPSFAQKEKDAEKTPAAEEEAPLLIRNESRMDDSDSKFTFVGEGDRVEVIDNRDGSAKRTSASEYRLRQLSPEARERLSRDQQRRLERIRLYLEEEERILKELDEQKAAAKELANKEAEPEDKPKKKGQGAKGKAAASDGAGDSSSVEEEAPPAARNN